MKQRLFSIRVMVAMVGLMLTAAARAAGTSERKLQGRVQHVLPGARQFEVVDQNGNRIQVTAPLRSHGMIDFYQDGDPVNASALHDGEMVLLTGISHDNWFEARRAEILTGERARGAKVPRPRAVTHEIRADRQEALDERRPGRGAPMPPRPTYRGAPKPLRLTYRGPAGWRTLIGEAADGTRYTVKLSQRTQTVYFRQGGTLVETSALHPGDTIDVEGVIQGHQVEATQVTIRR